MPWHEPPALTAPTEPISQLRAPGGLPTTRLLALLFQITQLAPSHPWPVPDSQVFWASRLCPFTVMLSQKAAVAQRWCGPASACGLSLELSTNTFGPVVSDCVT